jgi:hypothetical protein
MKEGDKAIGFRFITQNNSAGIIYVTQMDNYVGKSGTVVIGIGTTWPGAFEIQFDEPYNIWTYPILEYLTLQREEKLKELGIV